VVANPWQWRRKVRPLCKKLKEECPLSHAIRFKTQHHAFSKPADAIAYTLAFGVLMLTGIGICTGVSWLYSLIF